jgi:rSAM/selenodomain-associated transferase 2
VIVVDGGSRDETASLAEPWVDHYLYSSPGRAQQMNAGATQASGDCLMFLHADTLLPDHFFDALIDVLHGSMQWGFFPVRLSGRHWLLRWVERGMNLRSRLTSVATGDQAIWLSRCLWKRLEGFKCIALMEDIELSKRMREVVKPHVASQPLCTSSRRWESQGVVSTILLMWRLRLMYFLGISPSVLVRRYRLQNMD